MKETIGTQRHKASFLMMGVLFLLLAVALLACGPVPEEPAVSGGQSFTQGESTPEFAPTESENGPITSPQPQPQSEGAL